jgi:hypothetical protein
MATSDSDILRNLALATQSSEQTIRTLASKLRALSQVGGVGLPAVFYANFMTARSEVQDRCDFVFDIWKKYFPPSAIQLPASGKLETLPIIAYKVFTPGAGLGDDASNLSVDFASLPPTQLIPPDQLVFVMNEPVSDDAAAAQEALAAQSATSVAAGLGDAIIVAAYILGAVLVLWAVGEFVVKPLTGEDSKLAGEKTQQMMAANQARLIYDAERALWKCCGCAPDGTGPCNPTSDVVKGCWTSLAKTLPDLFKQLANYVPPSSGMGLFGKVLMWSGLGLVVVIGGPILLNYLRHRKNDDDEDDSRTKKRKLDGDQNPWLEVVGGRGAVVFRDLHVGDKFRFKGSPDVLRKTSASWYVFPNGKKFSTGSGTAVVPVRR